jgi:hypothetical protein
MIRGTFMALALLLAETSPALADYPRIAMISTSGAREYWDASYRRELASADLLVLSVWPGWGSIRTRRYSSTRSAKR